MLWQQVVGLPEYSLSKNVSSSSRPLDVVDLQAEFGFRREQTGVVVVR